MTRGVYGWRFYIVCLIIFLFLTLFLLLLRVILTKLFMTFL
jgi:hypothetical protein